MTARVTAELTEAINELPEALGSEDAPLLDAAKAALRRALGKRLQKRPLVDVHLLRV
jgi:ribonuclease J